MMSLWLSAANAWTGAAHAFWSAEMQRQQAALLNEVLRQGVMFWSGAWLLSGPPRQKPKLTLVQTSRR
jgi:hypothetical protein